MIQNRFSLLNIRVQFSFVLFKQYVEFYKIKRRGQNTFLSFLAVT